MDTGQWVSTATHPRVKPELRPQQLADGRVRIGGTTYTIAGEIDDPTGAVWTIVQGLDGSRTLDQVATHVCTTHPDVRPEDVRAAVAALAAEGYLDDAAEQPPEVLSQSERQRYERSRQFFRWVDSQPRGSSWDAQVRLRNASVTVVGLGGTGGSVAISLACSGIGRLHCVDHDVVELSNLNRQILYTESDIGRTKVDAAIAHLRARNSDITVTGDKLRMTGEQDFAELLAGGCDVLVLAADTPGEIRSWANRACLATGTPWVDGGYHGPVPTATAFIPGEGPCYECTWRNHHEAMRKTGIDGEYSVQRTAFNAVTAPTAVISGQLMANMVLALLTGTMSVTPGQLRGVDLLAADHLFVVDSPHYPNCIACGDNREPQEESKER